MISSSEAEPIPTLAAEVDTFGPRRILSSPEAVAREIHEADSCWISAGFDGGNLVTDLGSAAFRDEGADAFPTQTLSLDVAQSVLDGRWHAELLVHGHGLGPQETLYISLLRRLEPEGYCW